MPTWSGWATKAGSRAPMAARRFRNSPVPHGDNHDVWINPKNSQYHDPGQRRRRQRVARWRPHLEHRRPTSPPPRSTRWRWTISIPYRVYGAQQDNTTVIVPSLPLGNGQDFRIGPGCETGPDHARQGQPDIVYGGCKGQFSRQNHEHHGRRALLGGRGIALRQRRRYADLPLPARVADGSFAATRRTPFTTARSTCTARAMAA